MVNHKRLISSVRRCELCASHLPLGPKPIVQFHLESKILVAGQAPGMITHEKGIAFDDASGDRLRQWMGIDRETFYDETRIAVVPMGFCYPGKGKSGDLPPRGECAEAWREKILKHLKKIELTLVIGMYAQDWHLKTGHLKTGHLGKRHRQSVTQIVSDWQSYGPEIIPLPHPSPRNNIWLKKNPWFEKQLLPVLKRRINELVRNE